MGGAECAFKGSCARQCVARARRSAKGDRAADDPIALGSGADKESGIPAVAEDSSGCGRLGRGIRRERFANSPVSITSRIGLPRKAANGCVVCSRL